MTIFQAIVLGIVQGLSEFLPISSSGHLILVPELLQWNVQDRAFDVMVHVGTLFAVVVFFRKKLVLMFRSLFVKKDFSGNRRLFFLICISIIPAAIVGLFFGDAFEVWFRSGTVVACNLIFWGIVLWIADWYQKNKVESPVFLEQVTIRQALIVGLAQAIALIPGTSRSGITMTAGLFQKFSRQTAAEFSFLMSIPITALAGLSTLYDLFKNGVSDVSFPIVLVGALAAFVSGLIAIWLVFAVLKRMSFTPFVLYRIALGILILFLVN